MCVKRSWCSVSAPILRRLQLQRQQTGQGPPTENAIKHQILQEIAGNAEFCIHFYTSHPQTPRTQASFVGYPTAPPLAHRRTTHHGGCWPLSTWGRRGPCSAAREKLRRPSPRKAHRCQRVRVDGVGGSNTVPSVAAYRLQRHLLG